MLNDLQRRYRDDNGNRHFLVTEVTHMNGAQVCVAAIDLVHLSIVRLLKWNHGNWDESEVDRGLQPGRIVRQQIRAPQDAHGFPHQTEDLQLRNDLEYLPERLSERDLYETLAAAVDPTVSEIFAHSLSDGRYVVENTQCRSLGSVLVRASELGFHVSYDKPRLTIRGERPVDLDFPITDLRVWNAVQGLNREGVLRAIQAASRLDESLVLRVGLARAWAGPNGEYAPRRCYAQVNGLIFPREPGF